MLYTSLFLLQLKPENSNTNVIIAVYLCIKLENHPTYRRGDSDSQSQSRTRQERQEGVEQYKSKHEGVPIASRKQKAAVGRG
jgi:hypothetical protein